MGAARAREVAGWPSPSTTVIVLPAPAPAIEVELQPIPPEPVDVEVAYGTGEIPPDAIRVAIRSEQSALSAVATPTPIHLPTTVLTPSPVERANAAPPTLGVAQAGHTAQPFWQGLRLDSSWAHWNYDPIADDGPLASDTSVTTTERYDIEPVDLYRLALAIETRYATLSLGYESNQGFRVGDGASTLLDALVQFSEVPYLERFTFELTTLDFDHGEAALVERGSGAVLERARFNVHMTAGELRYRFLEHAYLFGRHARHALPRNVYLVEQGGADLQPRRQISEQLLQVETATTFLGVGLTTDDRERPALMAGLRGGIGFGDYTLEPLVGGARLDRGHHTAGLIEGHLGYRVMATDWLGFGVRDDLSLQVLSPTGLPEDMRDLVKAAGANPDDFALTFGQAEFINRFALFVEISI